jgi:hypothetical protein
MFELAGGFIFFISLESLLEISPKLGSYLHIFGRAEVQGSIVLMGKISQCSCQPFSVFSVIFLK